MLVKLAQFGDEFLGGKTRCPAIDGLEAALFQLSQSRADRAQIGMKPLDKSPAKQEIEPADGDESGRVVEFFPDPRFHQLALLQSNPVP